MPLNLGDVAPDFSLPDTQGKIVTLSALRGQQVVLYFYPRDNTPGCIKEACGFRDRFAQLQVHGIQLFGISTDDAKSHAKFVAKYELPFTLLCDTDAAVATAYDSYGKKKFMGKEFMGVFRNTFAIAADGTITRIYRKVKPETHPAALVADLLST